MTFTDVAEEIERLRSAKERVLKALQLSPGGLTNHYLRQSHIGGARAMGRVNELIHEDGYEIDVVRERGTTWRVTLRNDAILAAFWAIYLRNTLTEETRKNSASPRGSADGTAHTPRPLIQPPLLPRRTRPRRTAQARLF